MRKIRTKKIDDRVYRLTCCGNCRTIELWENNKPKTVATMYCLRRRWSFIADGEGKTHISDVRAFRWMVEKLEREKR